MTKSSASAAVVFGTRAGVGGLGHSAAAASRRGRVFALGPGYAVPWSLPGGLPHVEWLLPPKFVPDWKIRYSSLRWRTGDLVLRQNSTLGQWAADHAERIRPGSIYALTEV